MIKNIVLIRYILQFTIFSFDNITYKILSISIYFCSRHMMIYNVFDAALNIMEHDSYDVIVSQSIAYILLENNFIQNSYIFL